MDDTRLTRRDLFVLFAKRSTEWAENTASRTQEQSNARRWQILVESTVWREAALLVLGRPCEGSMSRLLDRMASESDLQYDVRLRLIYKQEKQEKQKPKRKRKGKKVVEVCGEGDLA